MSTAGGIAAAPLTTAILPGGRTGSTFERIVELDGVRGIAALSVMLYHLVPWSLATTPRDPLLRFTALVLTPGWLGVDLFFVLSGFLITGLLLRGRGKPRFLRTFYLGRAFRILPCYAIVLSAMWILYPHAGSYLLLSAVLLSNLAPLFSIAPVNGVLWSLAIEEHFYLGWPLMIKRLPERALLPLLAGICLLMPAARALGFHFGSDVYYYTWFRLDGLAWGAILAVTFERNRALLARLSRLLLPAAAVLIAVGLPYGVASRTTLPGAALQQSAAALVFAGLLAFLIGGSGSVLHRVLRTPLLVRLGELSYGTYLIHMVVLDIYNAGLRRAGWPLPDGSGGVLLRAAFCLGATLVLAVAMNRWVERPATALRRRLTARP